MTARSADFPFTEPDDGPAVAVTEALGGYGLNVRATDPKEWQLSMANRKGVARIDDGWLVLEFPPPRGRAPSPLRILERNAELSGNTKYVLLADDSVRLRAEVPIEEAYVRGAAGIAAQAREAVADLASALGASTPSVTSMIDAPGDAGGENGASSFDPKTLCNEVDWPHSERSSGRLHVDLDVVGGAFYQAAVERNGGRIVQRVELVAEGDVATESLTGLAIAALLLTVSGAVRMVRAVSWESGSGQTWGFEVQLPETTTVATFAHGLSALSVACGLCGREVRALAHDPALARLYLEIRYRRLMPKKRELRRRSSEARAAAS